MEKVEFNYHLAREDNPFKDLINREFFIKNVKCFGNISWCQINDLPCFHPRHDRELIDTIKLGLCYFLIFNKTPFSIYEMSFVRRSFRMTDDYLKQTNGPMGRIPKNWFRIVNDSYKIPSIVAIKVFFAEALGYNGPIKYSNLIPGEVMTPFNAWTLYQAGQKYYDSSLKTIQNVLIETRAIRKRNTASRLFKSNH